PGVQTCALPIWRSWGTGVRVAPKVSDAHPGRPVHPGPHRGTAASRPDLPLCPTAQAHHGPRSRPAAARRGVQPRPRFPGDRPGHPLAGPDRPPGGCARPGRGALPATAPHPARAGGRGLLGRCRHSDAGHHPQPAGRPGAARGERRRLVAGGAGDHLPRRHPADLVHLVRPRWGGHGHRRGVPGRVVRPGRRHTGDARTGRHGGDGRGHLADHAHPAVQHPHGEHLPVLVRGLPGRPRRPGPPGHHLGAGTVPARRAGAGRARLPAAEPGGDGSGPGPWAGCAPGPDPGALCGCRGAPRRHRHRAGRADRVRRPGGPAPGPVARRPGLPVDPRRQPSPRAGAAAGCGRARPAGHPSRRAGGGPGGGCRGRTGDDRDHPAGPAGAGVSGSRGTAQALAVAGTPLRQLRAGVRSRYRLVVLVLVVLVLCLALATLVWGVGPAEVAAHLQHLVGLGRDRSFAVRLRLPRVVMSVAVGVGFGLAGALFQVVLRNPLASPDIIGVTGGASLAGAWAILFGGLTGMWVSVAAFAGAATVAAVILLLSFTGELSGYRFVLVGVGLAFVCQSGIGYVITRSQVDDVRSALVWMVGSIGTPTWGAVGALALCLAVLLPLAGYAGWRLRAMQLGDESAAG